MADLGGFEIRTPQEVLADLQAQRQQIAGMRDPDARRMASIQFAFANLANPELDKAKRTEAAVSSAQDIVDNSAEAGNPGSIKYESVRLQEMYDAVKDIDPIAASQIQGQLLELDNARFERQRLKAISDRADRQLDIREQESEATLNTKRLRDLTEDTQYILTKDPITGEESMQAFDLNNSKSLEEFKLARQQPNAVALTRAEAADQSTADRAFADLMNKSDVATQRDTIISTRGAFDRGARLVEILVENPAANTSISALEVAVADVATDAKQAFARAGQIFAPDADQRALTRIEGALSSIEGFSEEYARDKETFNALTLNMAYALARSLDPSGRLSDADVMFAAKMIGRARGNPSVLARVLTEQLVGTHRQVSQYGNGLRKLPVGQRDAKTNFLLGHDDDMQESFNNYINLVRESNLFPESELNSMLGLGDETTSRTPFLSEEDDAAVDVGF